MKYTTFAKIFCFGVLAVLAFTAYLVFGGRSAPQAVVPAPVVQAPAAVAQEAPQSEASAPASVQPAPAVKSEPATTSEVRMVLEKWLALHPNREGKNLLRDIAPSASFRANAIRFPDGDAEKWSNDPSQWSQIRIDLTRDGVDDEKWLLKNGNIYKREVLDRSGKVLSTEYLK